MSAAPAPSASPKRRVGKLTVFLLIVATLLLPTGVIGFWSQQTLTNSATFAETITPLAEDPTVQQEVIDLISDSLIEAAAASGARGDRVAGEIRQITGETVRSDEFQSTFQQAVEGAHGAVIGLLSGSPDSTVQVVDGEVVVDFGAVQEQVVPILAQNGITINEANLGDATVPLAPAESVEQAQSVYSVGQPMLQWFFLLPLALLIIAFFVSPKKPKATVGVGIALLAGMALVGTGWLLGNTVATGLAQATDYAEIAPTAYGIVVGGLVTLTLIVAILGVVLIVAGLLWSRSGRNT